MLSFPYATRVLFMGTYYPGDALPWFFYPTLLGIQLTIPFLLLAVAGLGLALGGFSRQPGRMRAPVLLFLGWFLLPVIVIIAAGSTLYDNGRQLYFVLPPLFLLAGLALEALLPLLRWHWLQAAVLLLLLVPGFYGIVRLHPYEYVYYNQLVGGTGGAYGRYEMDYWGASYREVALWLDRHAASGSTIWATGPAFLLQETLRPDLLLSCASEIDCGEHYDYVVTLARWKAERRCTGARSVFTVDRRGAVFAVVRHLAPGQLCK